MKILVTGAGGMLASAFKRILTSSPTHTAVFCAKSDCDITNPESVAIVLDRERPDILINTAAYNGVDSAETAPDVARRLNANAVQLLAGECLKRGITIVHYSTDYVFDGTVVDGYRENDVPYPLSVYGQSKREGELAIEGYGSQGLRWYCIRTSRLFGPAGTSPESKKSFPQLIMEGSHDKPFECIDAEVSSPTFVDDLARATVHMAEAALPVGYYHRTNDGTCTWYEFGCAVVDELRKQGRVVSEIRKIESSALQRMAKRPAHSVLTTTKLPPLRAWQESLREYLHEL